MKTYEEFTQYVLIKLKKAKKKRQIKRTVISLSTAAVLIFLALFGNIIDFGFLNFNKSWKKFLRSYVSQSGTYASLKILDADNAALTLGNKVYPCELKSKSSKRFALTSYGENPANGEIEKRNFSVKFSGDTATVEGETEDGGFKETLNVVEDRTIESGVWALFASQVDDFPINYSISGAGWIMLLENGEAYMGEGMDSVYPSYFVGVGDRFLQYYCDPLSNLAWAAIFEYLDDGSFDFPAIKQTEFDGDGNIDCYFYYKLLSDDEKFDFDGGKFTAEGVTVTRDNYAVSQEEIYGFTEAKWQLVPEKSDDLYIVSGNFNIDLKQDGSVSLLITGNRSYNARAKGRWHRLKHCVLVILDKKNSTLGKAFTLHPGYDMPEYPSDDVSFGACAMTTIYSTRFYRVGYYVFNYYRFETQTIFYWGSGWDKENFLPKIIYGVHYVLDGVYNAAYYDNDEYNYGDEQIEPLPMNGKMSLIFRENGKMEIYRNGTLSKTNNYYFNEYSKAFIDFSSVLIYTGTGTAVYGSKKLEIGCLNIGAGTMFIEARGNTNDNKKFTQYKVVFKLNYSM